ncbi:hypothetical protein A3715_19110 [Oleiphilus sp. HI0009]|nr:hypothetical protein A3715_19110 [Oleiphilus sp. HI0009]
MAMAPWIEKWFKEHNETGKISNKRLMLALVGINNAAIETNEAKKAEIRVKKIKHMDNLRKRESLKNREAA